MADVADAAGVARATLYRYFPTRESLLEAVTASAAERASEGLSQARLDQVEVDEGVARAVRALLAVGDHFVVLASEGGGEQALEQPVIAPLRALVERGQAAGVIREDVPARWLTDALIGMVLTAARAAGPLGHEDIVQAVTGLFLDGARSMRPDRG